MNPTLFQIFIVALAMILFIGSLIIILFSFIKDFVEEKTHRMGVRKSKGR